MCVMAVLITNDLGDQMGGRITLKTKWDLIGQLRKWSEVTLCESESLADYKIELLSNVVRIW